MTEKEACENAFHAVVDVQMITKLSMRAVCEFVWDAAMKWRDEQDKSQICTQDRYNELLKSEKFLYALIECGVDNWPGYSDALQLMEPQQEECGE